LDEDEEVDYQHGLGDFGFGNLTSMREMNEEKVSILIGDD
jgi:hypothetical protein